MWEDRVYLKTLRFFITVYLDIQRWAMSDLMNMCAVAHNQYLLFMGNTNAFSVIGEIMKLKKGFFIFTLFLFVILPIAGAIYEIREQKQAYINYPPTGKLIDLGGRYIHMDCRGSGSPTVVFEAGHDFNGSLSWSAIHNEISLTTRACAYDRAGIKHSEPRDSIEHLGKAIAIDLNIALMKSGEQAPYILVGHSLGGAYITIFTKYYSNKVAGVVLVDSSHPDQYERLSDFPKESWRFRFLDFIASKSANLLKVIGVSRLYSNLDDVEDDNLDDKTIVAFSPTSRIAWWEEEESRTETLAEAGSYRDFGDKPLVVVAAISDFNKIPDSELELYGLSRALIPELINRQVAMHQEQAAWSSNSKLNLLYDTPHYVQFEKPQVVINAILSVIKDVE